MKSKKFASPAQAPKGKKSETARYPIRHRHHLGMVLTHELLDFLALFSHQLRTPLSIIKGYVAMLLDGTFGKLDNAKKQAFEKIYVANERMVRLVNDFLDLPRIHVGTMTYNLERISLPELLSHAVAEARLQADIKQLPVAWLPPSGKLPKVIADRENLLQVFSNILDNAIKYSNKGEIKIKLTRRGGSLVVAISDQGIGILKGELPGLFNKFMRGHDLRKLYREGRGLGLYIARRIMEGHGGRIWAESRGRGKGSTFFVSLPIAPQAGRGPRH